MSKPKGYYIISDELRSNESNTYPGVKKKIDNQIKILEKSFDMFLWL